MQSATLSQHHTPGASASGIQNLSTGAFFVPKLQFRVRTEVPLPLAIWAANGRRCNILRSYLLSRTTDGVLDTTPQEFSLIIGKSLNTAKGHLKKLVSLGFFGKSKTVKGRYNVRSLTEVCLKATGEGPGHIGIEAGDMVNLKKTLLTGLFKQWNKYATYVVKRSPQNCTGRSSPHLGGLAISVIAEKCGMSKSWAAKWRSLLKKEKYIQVKPNLKTEPISPKQLWKSRSCPDHCEVVSRMRIMLVDGVEKVVTLLASIVTPIEEVYVRYRRRW